jgi:two-component system OmpR family sensor kinase
MAQRVALVAVVSAAVGGLVAAGLAVVAVDQLIIDQLDQRLRAATLTLAGELDEEREEHADELRSAVGGSAPGDVSSVSETLDDENAELAESGVRLAVHAGERLLAGESALPLVAPGACETRGIVGARIRACARPYGDWLLIAAQSSDGTRLRWLYLLAAVAAVALGAASGAVLSRRVTRWAVEPLSGLSLALARSRPEAGATLELGPLSDCDEVEAIREELLRLVERVQLLLEQAQRFVGNAAHELRTPLTMLRAELDLHAEEAIDGKTRGVLDRASERVARLSDLIERLLVLALPPENLRQGFAAVSLAELVNEVALDLPALERDRLRLELESEGLVRGDGELLRSLVSNALGNALKFALRGSITVRLEERAASPASIAFTVRDEGPGIPAERRLRVFEAFFRETPNATAGHGIGLALVGHISRAHGGSAEFLDVPVGACLSVILPAWSESAQFSST